MCRCKLWINLACANLYEAFETERHFLFRNIKMPRQKNIRWILERLKVVTELSAGGDLLSYVRRRTNFTGDYTKLFFKQLTEPCIYCYKKEVVHHDIKLDNI